MSSIVVRPVRRTADVEAAVAFWEALGLARVPGEHPAGETDLVGCSGMIGLRAPTPAQPAGTTLLSAVVDDLDALLQRLRAEGVPARVEGDSVVVTDPRGTALTVDVDPTCATLSPHGDLHVLPMVYVEDHTRDREFFEAWGLQVQGLERPGHVNMGAPGAGGAISVHKPVPGRQALPELPGVTQLTLATHTPLGELAERIEAAGWATTMHHTPRGDRLGVVDPDGQVVKVHPR